MFMTTRATNGVRRRLSNQQHTVQRASEQFDISKTFKISGAILVLPILGTSIF